jgi:hypothetical protein
MMPSAATARHDAFAAATVTWGECVGRKEPGCHAILLAGRHVPTGWHEALIGRLLSAACLDALPELAESFAPGSMRDFVAHGDDKRHRPLDDLE